MTPALADYWADRRRKREAPARQQHPAPAQKAGRALPAVRGPAAARRAGAAIPEEWEQWHRVVRKAMTRSAIGQSFSERVSVLNGAPLVHASCQRRFSDAAAMALPA